jgi:hypothetical protein
VEIHIHIINMCRLYISVRNIFFIYECHGMELHGLYDKSEESQDYSWGKFV